MSPIEEGIAPCLIHIDKEGRWFHKGVEMVRREFVRSFYQQMELDDAGRYIIFWGGKHCYVDVVDTAFVVKRLSYLSEESGKRARFMVSLSDDTEEELIPGTLYLGEENVLYCRVKGGLSPHASIARPIISWQRILKKKGGALFCPSMAESSKLGPETPKVVDAIEGLICHEFPSTGVRISTTAFFLRFLIQFSKIR